MVITVTGCSNEYGQSVPAHKPKLLDVRGPASWGSALICTHGPPFQLSLERGRGKERAVEEDRFGWQSVGSGEGVDLEIETVDSQRNLVSVSNHTHV